MEQVVNDHGEVGKPRKDGYASKEAGLYLRREYIKSILNGPRKLSFSKFEEGRIFCVF